MHAGHSSTDRSIPPVLKWMVALLMAQAAAAHAGAMYDQPTLLGDAGGVRSALEKRGIALDLSASTELSGNLSGGDSHRMRAAGQIAAGVRADLDKLYGFHDTRFDFVLTDRFGRSVDADAHTGTNQQSQEIYGRGQTVWLTQLTLTRTFLAGRLEVSAGRDSEGSTFDAAPCNFQNLALCGPQGPNLYGQYWMSYPGSVWMTRAQWNTSATTFIGFGVYQQHPTYYDATWERHSAWNPVALLGTHGVVLPLEFGWTPTFDHREGRYTLGAMLNTGGRPDLTRDVNGGVLASSGLPAAQSGSSYNVYLAAAQRLTGMQGGEGLTARLRAVAGDRATSTLDRQMTLSLEYQNPFHQLGNRVGLGFAATHTNSRTADYQDAYDALHPGALSFVGRGYQYTSEIYYHVEPVKAVSLQPTLQYVVHPGGTSRNSNAVFLGLRTAIVF